MISAELLDAFADQIAAKVAAKLRTEKPATKRLLSASECASYLGRSLTAVKHMTSRGELPTVRVGRRVHYDVLALERWIQENAV